MFEPIWDDDRAIGTVGTGKVLIANRRGVDMAAWFAESSAPSATGGRW